MSKAAAAVAVSLISVLCMKALAGWVVEGVPGGGGSGGETNVVVRARELGGTSVVYVVTSSGHTNFVGRFRTD
jgi:hypothetical protein